MSHVTHFINPQVIDIDNVDSKVEALIDFVPIPVHAIYDCDKGIQIKCVNTTPLSDESTYQIQDLNGNPLSANDIANIFTEALPFMRHAEVSGNEVVSESLFGSRLTVINDELSHIMYPTNSEDISGNFTIKKEIFKTISSYLTNHLSLSLTDTIRDVSGLALDQLNAASHIANELKRFETVGLDVPGDDTKPFLNAFIDNNNSPEVFGVTTINKVIFIISSNINVVADESTDTGIEAESLSAIDSIEQRHFFDDELGDSLAPSTGKLNGVWYAALCFSIEIEDINVTVTSGPKVNFTASIHDPLTEAFLYKNTTKTDSVGSFLLDKEFQTELEWVKVVASNIDGSGYDSITNDRDFGIELSCLLAMNTGVQTTFMCTSLTSLLVNIMKEDGGQINETNYNLAKTGLESKLSNNPDFSLDVNPYLTTTDSEIAVEVSQKILEIEVLQESMKKVLDNSSGLSDSQLNQNILKGISKVFNESSGVVDLTDTTEIDKVIDKSVKEVLGNSTDTATFKSNNRTALSTLTSSIETSNDGVGTIQERLRNMHLKKKQISSAIENNDVNQIDNTVIDSQVVEVEDVVLTNPNNTSEPIVYNITVTSEVGNYILNGTDINGSFTDERDMNLIMNLGESIVFTMNAPGHPFYIKQEQSTGSTNALTTPVVINNGVDSGSQITFSPTAAGVYYYNCEFHSTMYGSITVVDPNTISEPEVSEPEVSEVINILDLTNVYSGGNYNDLGSLTLDFTKSIKMEIGFTVNANHNSGRLVNTDYFQIHYSSTPSLIMTVGNAGASDILTLGRDDSQSTSGYYNSSYVWDLYGSSGIQFGVPYMLKIEINQEPGVKLEMKNYTKGLNDADSEYTYLSTYTSTHSNNINRGIETSTWYAGNNYSSNIRPFNGTIHSIKIDQIHTNTGSSLPGTPSYNWDFTESTTDSVTGLDIAVGASINANDGLVFNGSNTYTTNTTINMGSNDGFSIFFEFKYISYIQHNTLMTFGVDVNGGWGSTNNGMMIKGAGSAEVFSRPQLMNGGNYNGFVRTDGNMTMDTNTFYKIVITTNGSQSKLYVDGVLVDTGTTAVFDSGNRTGIHLGGQFGRTDRNLNGSIKSIVMWDSELTESEISSL